MTPGQALREPVGEAARALCLDLVYAAQRAELRLSDPFDAEALHDFRVALRRLRSALRAWREPLGKAVRGRDRRQLSELQRSTGEGRDAEVALAWLERQAAGLGPEHRAGRDWIARALAARRDQKRRELDVGMRARVRARLARLEARLAPGAQVADAAASRFGEVLAQAAEEAVRALQLRLGAIRGASDAAAIHAARIACKRLRYLIEPARGAGTAAEELLGRCKALQDLVGQLNDVHVLEEQVHAALRETGVERATRVSELLRSGYVDRARREGWLTEWPGLIELAQRLVAERAALFVRLSDEWLEPGPEPLRQLLKDLVHALAAHVHGSPEIERKFLLGGLPALEERGACSVLIEQGWLPGGQARERLRAQSDGERTRFFRTLKLGAGLERSELERETSAEDHAGLWPATRGCRLRKRRYRICEGPLVFEIDEFLDRELVLAEVELPAADAPLVLPAWLAPLVVREVTGEPQYTGASLGR